MLRCKNQSPANDNNVSRGNKQIRAIEQLRSSSMLIHFYAFYTDILNS